MTDGHGTIAEAKIERLPAWPPGFWRRILLQPEPGRIAAALEDDIHSFRLAIDHRDGRVTAVAGAALRHPWTACPGAIGQLRAELPGERLEEIAARDPRPHCTHLFDLAVLCAAHAGDREPMRFDMKVGDRVGGRTNAILEEDGVERLRWRLAGLKVVDGGDHVGRDLRGMSTWKKGLPPREAKRATMLRRAVMVSGGRQFTPPTAERASDQGPKRMGVCYNYQLPQAAASVRTPDWRLDFSQGGRQPLDGVDPNNLFNQAEAEA